MYKKTLKALSQCVELFVFLSFWVALAHAGEAEHYIQIYQRIHWLEFLNVESHGVTPSVGIGGPRSRLGGVAKIHLASVQLARIHMARILFVRIHLARIHWLGFF